MEKNLFFEKETALSFLISSPEKIDHCSRKNVKRYWEERAKESNKLTQFTKKMKDCLARLNCFPNILQSHKR